VSASSKEADGDDDPSSRVRQIVLYVSSRVLASFIPRAGTTASASASGGEAQVKPIPPDARLFSLFAALSWGAVMWLFKHRGESIQPGMFSSMRYLYRESEQWNGLRTLLWHNR
jgi:peroxisomal membrane protein 4